MFSLQYPQGLEWQKVHFSLNEHLIRVAHALPPFGKHAVSQQSHGGRGNCHCISNSCSVTHSLTWQEPRRCDSAAFPHPGSVLPQPRTSSRQAGQQLSPQLLLSLLVLVHHPQEVSLPKVPSTASTLETWASPVSRNQSSSAGGLQGPNLVGTETLQMVLHCALFATSMEWNYD